MKPNQVFVLILGAIALIFGLSMMGNLFEKYQGNWVPQVVSGSGAGGALLEYMGIKAAKDLALDMQMGKGAGK